MIALRKANTIYEARGQIENGTFEGRWHFSFDTYDDPDYVQFGTLRVLNDDTLSPGAIWPLHPHREIEVVTYCAEGEFRHADEHGVGGILQKGWVQHTTVGRGMYHAEINNQPDKSMRFIQMWFIPSQRRLEPTIQQMRVAREDRANRFLLLVSNYDEKALPIHSEGEVFSSFLQTRHTVKFAPRKGWGVYLYLLEGGPVRINERRLERLDAAMVTNEKELDVRAELDAELLLVHVELT